MCIRDSRKTFAEKPAEFDPRKYLGPARDNMEKLYKHKIIKMCIRDRYTGAGGFELYFYPEAAMKIWDAVFEAGAEFGIKPCLLYTSWRG